MRSSALAVSLVVLSWFFFSGCSLFGNGSHSDAAPLISAANSPIADAPVPAGFALMKSQSTSKVIPASNVRFVDHQYSGPDDYLPVARFYRDQMPANGWVMADQTQSQKEIALHFTKASEDCVVTVTPGTFSTNTHIRIRIDPKARNAEK